uniref:Capsid protein n=1 Tax=Gorilla anellovirus TaxID=1743411 RepID=A0A0S2GMI2_9VIRU|nr:ORF1 [Gorilla anellovirus]
MPYFYNRGWRNFYPTRRWRRRRRIRSRRRWPRRRRARTTFRRTWRKRRRRRYKVKKFKKKKIFLQQWQPPTIKKCKIKGHMCLYFCAHGRESHNYNQYSKSFTPETYPGGGGFGIYRFNLAALFEQWQDYSNYWTKQNANLDLCRYTGCTFRFWRHTDVSYLVTYQRMYPMTVNALSHAECHPARILLRKKYITVPSYKDAPHKRKPFKKVRISPPSLMNSKWFFQKDLSTQGLLLLTASSCSLNHAYISTTAESNNITITCLDTKQVFEQSGWVYTGTQPYTPYKNNIKIWGGVNGTEPTKRWQLSGIKYIQEPTDNQIGNVFTPKYATGEFKIFKGNDKNSAVEMKDPLYIDCRYNPMYDNGIGNKVYLKSVSAKDYYDEPNDKDLVIKNIPLWVALYGWTDWQRKLRPGAQHDINAFVVIITDYITPKLPGYIVIGDSFIMGRGPYGTELTTSDEMNYYPKLKFQEETLNKFVTCGPFMPRAENIKSWEAHCTYSFFFKWGGALVPEQDIKDPISQPDYSVPDKLLNPIQIEDPRTISPYTTFHSWDYRRGLITESALKRMYEHQEIDHESLTGSETPPHRKRQKLTDPETYQEQSEIQKTLQEIYKQNISLETQEEETGNIQQQLEQYRKQQLLLRQQLTQTVLAIHKEQRKLRLTIGTL